jgi:radical SAM protein with 4Fe4S-binding SPASM domain
MVRADGEVFPCCRSQSFPGFTLGNVFDKGFQEIWNGDGYRQLRQTVNSATPPDVCAVCPRKAGLD